MQLAMRSAVAGGVLRAAAARPTQRVALAPRAAALARRPVLAVRASADDDEEEKKEKKPKKKIPSPVKRTMLAEDRRKYNKSRKSACATRIKKVIVMGLKLTAATATATAEDVKAIETLVSEAYEEIDKAVVKGILHRNNAAHKKSRVAKYKRLVAMSAGQFVPEQGHQDYNKYQRMMAKRQAVAAAVAAQ